MERRAPSVLLGILFLVGIAVGQDHVARGKAQDVSATVSEPVLASADLVKSRSATSVSAAQQQRLLANYSQLPLSFEPNQGQAGSSVKYLARGGQFNVFFTQNQVAFGFARKHVRRRAFDDVEEAAAVEPSEFGGLQLRLVGANPHVRVSGTDELPGRANYLVGRDPSQWHVNLPTFAKVYYSHVYPGVDLVYYGNDGELESDFIIAPGGDPQAVKLSVTGAEAVTVGPAGDLVLRMKNGELRLRKPLVYQQVGNSRKEVAGDYVLAHNGLIGFRVAKYDHKQPLIIDPVLSYSTYLGGNGSDEANAIAVDAAGNAYITGDTTSTNFSTTLGPTTGDMFVAKLSPTGTKLYATYVGGTTTSDYPASIGVDTTGSAYVVGQTADPNLPTTTGALIKNYPGGSYKGFVFSLNSGGSAFNYFTYLGGSAFDLLTAVALDGPGNAYITGQTTSGDYPVAGSVGQSPNGGGIFASTDGGSSWAASTTGLVNKNITVIAADPNSSGTVYAATVESGIIKSTNSGGSWSASNGTSPNTLTSLFVNGLVLDPATANKLYAGASGGGVFVSTDGGANWAAMNNGLGNLNVTGLAADPTAAGAGTLYAATGGRVWKFSAGLWTGLPQLGNGTGGAVTSIVVDPSNNQSIYVGLNGGGVYHSADGGNTWTQFITGLSSLQVMSLAMDHAGHLYAGTGTGGVFLSTSGGNWGTVNNGLPLSVFVSLAVDPANNVYVGTRNAGVFKSTNNGGSWSQSANAVLRNTRVTALAVDPVHTNNVYAGSVVIDAVFTKLNPAGGLLFSGYLGGGGGDAGLGIAIDGDNGNLYVAGFTNSLNFPTAVPAQAAMAGGLSGFVTKIKSDGSGLVYSTYLGGPLTSSAGSTDQATAIAADASGNAYVTGITNSTGFPVANPVQAALQGAVNAFIAEYNPSGQKLFATYLGGEGSDSGNAITVTANSDGSTTAWVAGNTSSEFFPLANPIQLDSGNHSQNSGFISAINFPTSAVPKLTFSSFLGTGCGQGCGDTVVQAIGHDSLASGNNIYVAGRTANNGFPTVNALQSGLAGQQNAFIAKIGSSTNCASPPCNADLSLTLNSFAPNVVTAGGIVNFSATITNNGPDAAPNVALGGRGGANIKILNCSTTQGICGDQIQTIDRGFAELGTLASGASATVTAILQPQNPCGVTGAPACPYPVEIDVRSDANDPNPANNSATSTLTVNPGADLAVDLNQSPSQVTSTPANVTYNAVVNNLGPSDATNVTAVFSFAPAAALTFGAMPGSCSAPTTANGTATVTCNVGAITAGTSLQLGIPTTLSALPVTVTVVVSNSPEADPDPTNNFLTLTTGLASGVNNAELNGHYAFVVRGFDINGLPIAIGASFAADGAGNVTGGVMDINSAASGVTTLPITSGTYTIGADNRGFLKLTTSAGTQTFDFDVGLISSGVASLGHIISRQNYSAAPASLSNGLLGYWQFNGNANDSSGRGNTLTLNGSASFGLGLFGQGLSLNGVQGTNASMPFNNTPNTTPFDFGAGDFTVQVWAKFNAIPGEQTLLEKFSGSTGPGWSLTTPGGNTIQFYTQGGPILNSATVAIPTGSWQQFVVQRSGTTWNLFWNGNTTPVATTTNAGSIVASTNPLLFGARNSADGRNFTVNGTEDEVAIWNRALTTAEIGQLWNNGAGMAFGRTGSAISGNLKKQDPAVFTVAALNGDWAFLTEGTNPNGGRDVSAGRLTLNGGNATLGSMDSNNGGNFDNGTTTPSAFTGSLGTLDTTNGRVLITTTTGGPNPANSAIYIVSANELLDLGVDPVTTDSLRSGSALRQDTTTFCPTTGNCNFTNNALNGNSVLYMQGISSAGPAPGASEVQAGVLTFTPASGNTTAGAISGGMDKNDGGNITTPSDKPVSATYSVAANGRATITDAGAGGNGPVLYLVNTNQAFILNSNSRADAGALEPQVGPIQFTSDLRAAGTLAPAVSGTQVFDEVETIIATSNTTADATNNFLDSNSVSGGLRENFLIPNFSVSDLDPVTGRFTFTDGGNGGSPRVGYFVNSSRRITINADPTVTTPFIITSDAQNVQPAPAITSLSPSSALAGGAAFTLTVNGTGFVSTSVVNFGVNARTTTFVNSTQLTAAILASDIANAANVNVTVTNPSPGGGTSAPAVFVVSAPNPVPTITSLSPANAAAGAAAFTLTVNGTGFVPTSVVNFGANARATTFVSATQLTAAILASDIASTGSVNVTVTNPAPGGGISNTVTFAIGTPSADLAVTMTASPNPVSVLGSITYQITATNNGPSPATGVVLTDTVPAGTVFASIVDSADSLAPCTVASGTVTCTFASLASNSSQILNLILVPLVVPSGGSISNTVSVTANEIDPNLSNNSATQTVQVTGTNLPGGGAFRNLPGFSSNILAPNDDSSTPAVPLGFSNAINFFGVQVSSVFVNNNGNITFGSSLSTFTPFPLTSTNVQIIAPYFSDVDTAFAGSGLVTYGNDTVGGRPAFGVNSPNVEYYGEGSATLLDSFQLILVDRSDISVGDFDIEFNYDKIQWETGNASGGSGGLGGSSARVGYSNGTGASGSFFELPGSGVPGSFLDSNTTTGLIYNSLNSTQPGRYVFQVRGGVVQSSADLAITATGPSSALAGTAVTYTLTATNAGPNTATGVVVTDTLPLGFTFVSAAPSLGACAQPATPAPGQPVVLTCTVGSLPVGSNGVTITIQAAIPAGLTAGQADCTNNVLCNVAVVSAPNNQDLNLGNNTSKVPTSVTGATTFPDLTITKTHSGNFSQGHSGATYTITVNNIGTGPTSGTVTVTDTLPTGLSFVSAAGSGWTCSAAGQVVTCTTGDVLSAGAAYPAIALTVNVANDIACSVTNSVTVSGGGEVNTANDTADDPTDVGPCVSVAVVQPANANGTVSYAVIVTNGSSDVTGLDVSDQLTGNASFVSATAGTSAMACPSSSPLPNPLHCTLQTLPANSSVTVTFAVQLNGTGWSSNTVHITLQSPSLVLARNAALVQQAQPSGSTVTGANVVVQPVDKKGSLPAVLTYANVMRSGTTTVLSSTAGPPPPAGFRTGTPAVFYNLATTAGFSSNIGLTLGFSGVSFHHPANVRLFHYENGGWVNRTVAVNPARGYAVGLVSSLSPFALFEPVNRVPMANAGPDRTLTASSTQGTKITLDGSGSSDADQDPLTYRWTGPFPEGNGVVTGINPTVTLPPGANHVTLVVNDGEVDSAPASQTITITDFSIVAAAASATTITAGQSTSFNITSTSQFGPFPAAVSLACVGLPQGARCNFSSPTMNVGGAAVVLTIATMPRAVGVLAPFRHGNHAPLYALWMPLPAIALMGMGTRRRSCKKTVLLLLVLLAGLMMLLVSCGGGSMGATPQPQPQNGTPAGNYSITVTGTANGTLQHQAIVSFTVQ